MKSRYLIVGDNNYWFATVTVYSQEELDKEVNSVREGIRNGDYNVAIDDRPTEIMAIQLSDSKSNDITYLF